MSERLRGALVRTFMARGIAVLGVLFLLLVTGRLYGPEGAGVLALVQSLMLGIATLARYGTGGALMRFAGRAPRDPALVVYVRWSLSVSLAGGTLGAVLLAASATTLESLFSSPGLARTLLAVALAMPAFTVAFTLAGFFKGVRQPGLASLLENGAVALAAVPAMLLLHGLLPDLGVAALGWGYAVASWAVLVLALLRYRRWRAGADPLPAAEAPPRITPGAFFTTAQAFFFTNLAVLVQSSLGMLVAGWLLTTSQLGLFKAAQQLASVVSFVLVGLNAVYPPLFAALHQQHRHGELAARARQGALVGTLLAGPAIAVCLLAPEWVLTWVGPQFVEAAPLLRIIALAQLVNVACGSVGFVLNMTGQERLMRNISLSCAMLSLALFFVLIPALGTLGAALALATALVAQNLTALYFVRRFFRSANG